MVAFSKIFKQAYGITKQYKFLWIFGLFLICGNLLFAWFNQTDLQLNFKSYSILGLFVGSILVFVLYFRGKVSLIIAVKAILDKQEATFLKAFQVSRLYYSQILAIYFVLELGILVLGLLLSAPIEYLFRHNYFYRGIGLLILALVIFIPVLILALLINVLAPMFVVIFNLKIRQALERSFELVSKFWLKLSILGLLMILIELPALFLAVFMVGLRRGLLIQVAGAVVFLALESVITVFQQTAWILVFLDLVKPQKLEEEEPVVVTEVAN